MKGRIVSWTSAAQQMNQVQNFEIRESVTGHERRSKQRHAKWAEQREEIKRQNREEKSQAEAASHAHKRTSSQDLDAALATFQWRRRRSNPPLNTISGWAISPCPHSTEQCNQDDQTCMHMSRAVRSLPWKTSLLTSPFLSYAMSGVVRGTRLEDPRLASWYSRGLIWVTDELCWACLRRDELCPAFRVPQFGEQLGPTFYWQVD